MRLRRHAPLALVGRKRAAGAGIERPVRAMRRGGACRDLGGDGGAGAEAGIDQARRLQPVQRLRVERQPLATGRRSRRPSRGRARPGPRGSPSTCSARDAARVDILDPQQEGAAALAGEIVGEQGRAGMAEMQPSGRARREAGDDLHRIWTLDRESRAMLS